MRGNREHFVARIHQHVILLALHFEVRDALRDRVIVIHNADRVILDVVRMAEKLPAGHPLVIDGAAKRIAHAAVKTGDAHSADHGIDQIVFLIGAELPTGPKGYDQVQCFQALGIFQHLEPVCHLHLETPLGQFAGEEFSALDGLMTVPTALKD